MMIRSRVIVCLAAQVVVVAVVVASAYAQPANREGKLAVFVEILGSSLAIASVNVEHQYSRDIVGRTGIGYLSIVGGEFSLPFTVSYLLPPITDSKRFEAGLGATFQFGEARQNLAQEPVSPVIWSALIAYRFTPPTTGTYFRPVVTLMAFVEDSEFVVFPFVGLGFGHVF